MNGLVRNTTARLSRRFEGYEPLDRVMRSDQYSRSRHYGGGQRRRSLSFKHKKAAVAADIIGPLRTREDRAKQRRQIFLNSYKFASADQKLQRRWSCRRLKKVAAKVKTAAAKLLSSFLRIGGSSCNCRLAIRASSPIPRGKSF